LALLLAIAPACKRSVAATDASSDGLVLPEPSEAEPDGGTPYRVTDARDGGAQIEVPSLGVSAWLPERPTRRAAGFLQIDHHFVHQEELAVDFLRVPGVGCSIDWFAMPGALPSAQTTNAVLSAHAGLLHARVVRDRDVRFAEGEAKDALLAMTIPPNVGTARVRIVPLDAGIIVIVHTYVHGTDRKEPIVERCLDSPAFRGADGGELRLPPFPF
jgi:hypothetical protein